MDTMVPFLKLQENKKYQLNTTWWNHPVLTKNHDLNLLQLQWNLKLLQDTMKETKPINTNVQNAIFTRSQEPQTITKNPRKNLKTKR